jgi:glutaredoxin
MDQMEITIYAKRSCPHCRRAKRFLRRRRYAFEAVDMTDDGGLHAWLGCFIGRKTVPTSSSTPVRLEASG